MQHWLQESACRRPAEATLLIHVEVADSCIVPSIEVRRHRYAHFDGGLRHGVEHIPPHTRPFHTPLAADSMMFRFAQKMIIKSLEHWTDIVPAPAGEAELPPVIIIRRLATHGYHRIDRGRTADHLAARIFQRTAVKAGLALRFEHPVRTRIADGEEITDRNVKPDPVVVATGFQNQNTIVAIGR